MCRKLHNMNCLKSVKDLKVKEMMISSCLDPPSPVREMHFVLKCEGNNVPCTQGFPTLGVTAKMKDSRYVHALKSDVCL